MTRSRWILFICAALTAGHISADEQTQREPAWYEIELIIFARNTDAVDDSEKWPESPGMPDWSGVRPLQPGIVPGETPLPTFTEVGEGETGVPMPTVKDGVTDTLPTTGSTSIDMETAPPKDETGPKSIDESGMPIPFALLPESEYGLAKQAGYLQKSSQLRPLLHLAWRQPLKSSAETEQLYLRTETDPPGTTTAALSLSTAPPALEGTVRVSLNRYLHVELDLLLSRLAPPAEFSTDAPPADESTLLAPQYRRYRMRASRRMRSSELHYIDHPLMGALVRISPFELPKPKLEKRQPLPVSIEPSARPSGWSLTQPPPKDTHPQE